MFYNGQTFMFIEFVFFIKSLIILFDLLFSNFSNIYVKNINSDFSTFLYTLSSPTTTICFLISLLFFHITKNLQRNIFIVICWLLTIFFFSKHNYINTNVKVYLNCSNVNLSLQNGLINIHPVIIYYLYSILILIWTSNIVCITSNGKYYFNSNILLFNLLKLAIFGIFLGAFWASQELNWGGFWSWDPIELSSLFIFLYLLKITHNQKFFYKNNFKLYELFIIICIFYCIIRLGVVNTIHSFVRSNNLPIFISIFIIYVLLLYIIIYSKAKNKKDFYIKITMVSNIYITHIVFLFYFLSFYLFLLILTNFVNLNKYFDLHPSFVYFFVLFCILTFFVINQIDLLVKNKAIFIIYLLLFLDNICFCIFLLFCTKMLYKHKTVKTLHVIILIVYVLCHYILIQLYVFSKKTYMLLNWKSVISSSYFFWGNNNIYESFFFLKKKFYFDLNKSYWSHVTGFNIHSTSFISNYVFTKNSSQIFLFCNELVFYLFILFVFTTYIHTLFINLQYKKTQKFYIC